jgi:uncharacterized hydantoinase/oxoprolinase family protein
MLGITIRLGAAHNEVRTSDGTVFDRSKMTLPQRKKLTRLVRDLYEVHLKQGANGKGKG